MKQFFAVIIAMACVAFGVSAQSKLVFIAGKNVCTPIIVKCQGESYEVYSRLEVARTSSSIVVTATDCNGMKLKYDFDSDSGTRNGKQYSISTYIFHPVETYGSDNSSGNYNSNSHNNSWSNVGYSTGQALGQLMFGTGGGGRGKAYPGIYLQAGLSKSYGEFARLRITVGGFNIFGGIGKDWIGNGVNKDKLLWHAGLGGYYAFGGGGDPKMDTSFSLTVAENAVWKDLSLMIDVDYTYWFGRWRRVGVFAGGGIGWGGIKYWGEDGHKSDFAWNLEIGLALRIVHF